MQQLRYAVAVADERHFGRAARACFISQPALSTQVRELESRLGAQLFERTSRGVLVTAVGEEVLGRARRILSELDDLCEAAGAGAELGASLRLGVIPTLAPYLLPAVVPAVEQAHAGLELYLREDRTDALVDQLLGGDLDLLLLALPLDRPGVAELALYDEPFLLAVPESHPLATRRRCDLSALAGERLVLLEEGHCLRDQALAVCELAGHDGLVEVQGTSLPTVVQMVGSGLGVTLLPAGAVERDLGRDERVVVRDLEPEPPTRTVGLAWRSSSARADAYRRLGGLVTEAVRADGRSDPPGRR